MKAHWRRKYSENNQIKSTLLLLLHVIFLFYDEPSEGDIYGGY